MNPTSPSFFSRLAGETPLFWKKTQIFCLIMSVIIGYLMKFNVVPQQYLLVAAGMFAGIAFIAQCAVKDLNLLQGLLNDPASIAMALPELIDQVNQIHTVITTAKPLTPEDAGAQIKVLEQEQPIKAAPVSKAKVKAT